MQEILAFLEWCFSCICCDIRCIEMSMKSNIEEIYTSGNQVHRTTHKINDLMLAIDQRIPIMYVANRVGDQQAYPTTP